MASARELRRQQREEEGPGDEAEGAEEGPGPPRANLSPSSSFRAQRSARGSTFSLWQDIPDVRGSGVLATLSLRDCKLQEVGAWSRRGGAAGAAGREVALGPAGGGATEGAGPGGRGAGSPDLAGPRAQGFRASGGLHAAGGGRGTQRGKRGHERAGPAGSSVQKVGARTWGWLLAGTEPPRGGGWGRGVGSGAEPTGQAEGRSQAGRA